MNKCIQTEIALNFTINETKLDMSEKEKQKYFVNKLNKISNIFLLNFSLYKKKNEQ